MNDEYQDNDFVDPAFKHYVSKHRNKVIFGVVAFFVAWPVIILLICL